MDTNKIELTLSPELKSVDIGDKLQDGKLLEEMTNLGLTHDEINMVDEFSEKIDIKNSQQILEYGVGVQKKLSDFSEKTLDTIRTKDLGEIGSMISSLVVELKGFDAKEEKKFLGFLRKGPKKAQILKANYDKAQLNLDTIVKSLESQQIGLMKDISMLDQMYDLNKDYYKEISMYILAGKKKIDLIKNTDLPILIDRASTSGSQELVQEVDDLKKQLNRFEKKIYDLELTRMIAIQTGPQIRMVQNNNVEMVEKIQSTIVNTIPLWKNQMVLAIGALNSGEAIKTQRQISDITNDLLKQNAETIKMATIEAAKESERGIVDVETIKNTNDTLINSLDEMMRIHSEGSQKRLAAQQEIQRLEGELKNKMLEIASKR